MQYLIKQLLFFIICCICLSCKAQTIISLHTSNQYGKPGYYYKDLGNDLNNFEGTWVYTNGTTSLTLQLQKKEKVYSGTNSNYYYDTIIGEYKYIENGIEKINTLSNLNQNYEDAFRYNIVEFSFSKFGDRTCYPNCEPGNLMIKTSYREPNCKTLSGTIRMRYYTEAGQEKLNISFFISGYVPSLYGNEVECLNFITPVGEYTLIKQ